MTHFRHLAFKVKRFLINAFVGFGQSKRNAASSKRKMDLVFCLHKTTHNSAPLVTERTIIQYANRYKTGDKSQCRMQILQRYC